MSDINSAAKAYARFVMKEMNLSPSALAKGAKLASTTLTRALNDPTHQFNLSTTTINKIAQFSGISPAPFFEAKDFAAMALSPHSREDFYLGGPLGRQHISEEQTPMNMTYVIGQAAAGVWKNPEVAPSDHARALAIALPLSKKTDVFALQMADDSAMPFVRKGEFAICRRIGERGDELSIQHGDLVAVERWTNGLMELTLRRAIVSVEGQITLRHDNADARYSERLSFDPNHRTASLKVIGIAAYSVRDVQDPLMIAERLGRPQSDPFA